MPQKEVFKRPKEAHIQYEGLHSRLKCFLIILNNYLNKNLLITELYFILNTHFKDCLFLFNTISFNITDEISAGTNSRGRIKPSMLTVQTQQPTR